MLKQKPKEQCPICEEGYLSDAGVDEVVVIDGHKTMIRLQMSVCDHCQCEQAGPDQIDANAQAMRALRMQIRKENNDV